MAASEIIDLPEPDRAPGAPHPRATGTLYGQHAAEAAFLDAYAARRLHHGWLLTGPRGVGKATLAWRIARFLLATPDDDGGMFAPPPPRSLDIPRDHPVARRIASLSEGRLFLLRRGPNEAGSGLSADTRVEEVRRLKSFFQLSAADGGRRVAIIDSADDLNVAAANALLKLLEEPPASVTLLLISHQPALLLPTVRSRCRELRLQRLDAADLSRALDQALGADRTGDAVRHDARSGDTEVQADDGAALVALSDGSVGDAVRLTQAGGLAAYADLVALFATMPRLDRMAALRVADTAAGKGQEGRFDLLVGLIDLLLARLARAGTRGHRSPEAAPPDAALRDAAPGEAALWARLAPTSGAARAWADLQQSLGNRARRGRAVNLDPATLLMDMVVKADAVAARLLRT